MDLLLLSLRKLSALFSFLFLWITLPLPAATFNKDIAPILFNKCFPCHHEGQSAPFNLMTFSDLQKHSKQVLQAVETGYMPPWPPEPHPIGFKNDRSLSLKEKETLLSWLNQTTHDLGNPADLPKIPEWSSGWTYGVPDRVIQMPTPFSLGADGPDIYRSFIIPSGIISNANIRLLEFHPGNARILHHALIKIDTTQKSAALEKQGGEVGIPGMSPSAFMPNGQFLSWQPGRLPLNDAPVWALKKQSYFVIQAHLNRSGKREDLQSSIGLYFTDRPADTNYTKVYLGSLVLDIKPGETNHIVEDAFTLPVDCQIAAVLPHAHFLCRSMEASATLPGGKVISLLKIKKWDFNWQGDYHYLKPLDLPGGTLLSIRYVYDNSSFNEKNPNVPPREVFSGPQSQDEMCEFWIHLQAKNPADRPLLDLASDRKNKQDMETSFLFNIKRDPLDSNSLSNLGMLKLAQGKLAEAEDYISRSVQANPQSDMARYRLGLLYRMTKRSLEAVDQFQRTVALNPANEQAWGNLGLLKMDLGDPAGAKAAFTRALALDPADQIAAAGLRQVDATSLK